MDEGLIKKIRRNMSLDEMVSLCSGNTAWETLGYAKYGIEPVMMADGPHGMRVEEDSGSIGVAEGKPATCFPPAVLTACSWDEGLLEFAGKTIALEARALGVDLILGPGINVKRSPLCGRNFEYFSEDPLLSGRLGTSFILGAKSHGVGCTVKHYLANNQETRRMTIDEKIDIRALREIYLKPFEIVIKEGEPMAVMSSYNSINGKFVSQSRYFLTRVLRDEWGFDGIVISDWNASYDRVKEVMAGMDLEMPGNGGINNRKIFDRIKEGKLKVSLLNEMVERLIRFSFLAKENRRNFPSPTEIEQKGHHQIAKLVALESMVLLKNDDNILPIDRQKIKKLAVIGSMAFDPRYQGSGSSKINPYHIDTPYEHIKILAGDDIQILPHQGYIHDEVVEQIHLEAQAVELAKNSQLTLLFVGLPDHDESEGYDRVHLNLPKKQISLINKICKVQPETVVIVQNGGVVDMNWENGPKAIVEMFLGGQAGGDAIAELLFGENNFCGKLAETIPMKLEDTPAYINFPGIQDEVVFGESIFVGYRYYDYTKKKVRFPFGYGQSYTTFKYEKIEQGPLVLDSDASVVVKCRITNTGKMNGKEIVQLYTGNAHSQITRPLKELRGFKKVFIPAGQSVEISFTVDLNDFMFYNPTTKRWEHESGTHEIYIGASSRDLPIVYPVEIVQELIRPITQVAYIGDFEKTDRGQIILKILLAGFEEIMGAGQDMDDAFLTAMLKNTPLRKIVEYSRGIFTEESIKKIISLVNSDVSLEGLTFEMLVDGKEKKKGFFENLFGGNKDEKISIHSKIKDLVDDDHAMVILRKYFDDETFESDYLQMAIKMGVCLDKAQKLLPEDFFSDEMLKEIDRELKEMTK
ncbi:glycosyl hydrolase [Acetobacterium paludosum]|uniref:Glycosyl hydrolase n=1 Tax=Acetobacterium paludosum TaxID=52693 RepID=A0A923HVP8_9FIRM|nr:glycoside hydrolase family 3 C-terminal domain-containing protein [Acetobacterium paludosum]MBC3888527.1 glycosyl hydrolase [Acetobacterium paludosum]